MKDNLFLVHGIVFKLRSKLKHNNTIFIVLQFLKLEMLEKRHPTITILQNFFNNDVFTGVFTFDYVL